MIQFSANLYSETILPLVGIYLFKVIIKNTRKRCELYPKLLEKDKCICISVFIFFEKELLHNCFSCILINMCWWLFLLIKSQKMKSTVIPAFIFVINFEMKQNVSETEGIWHFRKNDMSTTQEMVFDAAFKAWPSSSGFNFACKDGRVTAATCKYHCPLIVNPIITNCCKELRLKCGTVPRSVFENIAMHEY